MLDELRELREGAAAVRARVDEAAEARRQASAAADAAEEEYAAYQEGVGAGEREPDEEQQQRLTAALALARAAASPNAWRGRLRGAERAAQEADGAVAAWLFAHAHELGDELATLAGPLAERAIAHYAAQLQLEDEIAVLIRHWYEVAEPLGLAPYELPTSPFRGSSDDVHFRLGGDPDPGRMLVPTRGWPLDVDGQAAVEDGEWDDDGDRRVDTAEAEFGFRHIDGVQEEAGRAAANLRPPGRLEG